MSGWGPNVGYARPMRGSRRRETALSILFSVCVAACAGCDGAPSQDLPERHARRFIPFDSNWIPESEVPEKSAYQTIWEFSETLDEPGPAERKAAKDWLERCYEAAQRNGWYDFEKGIAGGWESLMPTDPYHYRNREYMLDGVILDPERPEFLMYYPKPDGTRALAGFMFITRTLHERGPQFAGRISVWHYHDWARPVCVEKEIIWHDFATGDGRCERGEPLHRSPEMIHTWLIDHPKGPFATSMILPPSVVVAGLEQRMRKRGF
jgi:hypothetical protein